MGDLVQPDKTSDDALENYIKAFLKVRDHKPWDVFLGVVHRIDRPVSGVVLFAKTSKALTRLNDMFRNNEIHKTYWAIVQGRPKQPEAHLTHYITSVERNNKSYASLRPKEGAARSELIYRTLAEGENYSLLEINLITGRKHQIRVQLSTTGTPIKGDLKYGARRSNPDGSISLLARSIRFVHPVSKKEIYVEAPVPDDKLWAALTAAIDADK
mgnify:CR=1 FL=1